MPFCSVPADGVGPVGVAAVGCVRMRECGEVVPLLVLYASGACWRHCSPACPASILWPVSAQIHLLQQRGGASYAVDDEEYVADIDRNVAADIRVELQITHR